MREHRALDTILEPGGITPVYQPIMRLEDRRSPDPAEQTQSRILHGFECLSRGRKGTNFESAKVMFEYVRLKREETLVDRACIATALASAPQHDGLQLTVNVHASTLARDHEFTDFLCATASANSIACEQLTVEIVEHAPPWDSSGFIAALDRLRDRGMRISLDDVGLGQSSFKMILDVRPDFLKLDRYFVDACESDPNRRAVIEAVASLASHFGAQVIAEGVDREEAAETLLRYGVKLMQGHLFAAALDREGAREFLGCSS